MFGFPEADGMGNAVTHSPRIPVALNAEGVVIQVSPPCKCHELSVRSGGFSLIGLS